MVTVNDFSSILVLIVFIYALYIVPKAIGEIRGIYMETPDPFYGKFELDCKWTHGATYRIGILSYVIAIPLLLAVWEQIQIRLGLLIATIIVFIILIPFKIYYDKQKKINAEKAYKKNIADGFLKESDPMPNVDGRITKLYKKITKKE